MRLIVSVIILLLTASCSQTKDNPYKIYLNNHKVLCKGYGTETCYTYKEGGSGELKVYTGEIEGLDYAEGYSYELMVHKVKTSPSDSSVFRLVLDKEIKKTPTMVIPANVRELIDNKEFLLVSLRTGSEMISVDDKNLKLFFYLIDNKIRGDDGCNTFFAEVTFDNDKMSVSNVASTRMFCENVTIDKDFYKAINSIDRYEVSGDHFKMYKGDELMLEYRLPEQPHN